MTTSFDFAKNLEQKLRRDGMSGMYPRAREPQPEEQMETAGSCTGYRTQPRAIGPTLRLANDDT